MRRVLMISPHFPPDSTAGTHRVRLLAPHLRAYGWEPTVLTVDPRDYEGRLDPALADSVDASVRVIRVRAWPAAVSRRFAVGDLGIRAFAALRHEALRLLGSESFDAFFITIYPTYPALLGPLLKRRTGRPFVLDYQDPWVGEWGLSVGPSGAPDAKSRATRALARALEPIALRAADGVTAVSRLTFEQALSRVRGARPAATEEIPIGWDPADFAFLTAHHNGARRWPADRLVHLVYVGTLLPTGHDTLRAVLSALGRIKDEASGSLLRLHFFGTSNQRTSDAPGRVMPFARELGVDDRVTEHPVRLDYFDALSALGDAHGVLLMGSREPHYTPSKVFPALASRRPIVAVLHDSSTATGLLRRAGAPPSIRLVSYDDHHPAVTRIDELSAALRSFAADPSFRADAIDWSVLEPTTAKALAGRLAATLDRTVERVA